MPCPETVSFLDIYLLSRARPPIQSLENSKVFLRSEAFPRFSIDAKRGGLPRSGSHLN